MCIYFQIASMIIIAFYSWKIEEQRGAVILGAQFKTPGPNLSGYLPLCNSSDIQSRAPIESCCSCDCSALLQIRPWSLKSGIRITGNMQLVTMCAKFGVRTLVISYKRYVAQAGRNASSSSDWHSIALSKMVVIVFPNSSTVFKTQRST